MSLQIDFNNVSGDFTQIGQTALQNLQNDVQELKLTPEESQLVARQLASIAQVSTLYPAALDQPTKDALLQQGREAMSNLMDVGTAKEHLSERAIRDEVQRVITQALAMVLAAVTAAA